MNSLVSRPGIAAVRLAALAALVVVGGCSRPDPATGVSQSASAGDRTNRAGSDGSGDGPTALSPADAARAASASASDAASTVSSSNATGTSPMPTGTVPRPSQGSPNARGGVGK